MSAAALLRCRLWRSVLGQPQLRAQAAAAPSSVLSPSVLAPAALPRACLSLVPHSAGCRPCSGAEPASVGDSNYVFHTLYYIFYITRPGHLGFVHVQPCEGTNPVASQLCCRLFLICCDRHSVLQKPRPSRFILGLAGVAEPGPGKLHQAVSRSVKAAINDSLLEASSLEVHCLKQQCASFVRATHMLRRAALPCHKACFGRY